MSSFFFNRGKYLLLEAFFRDAGAPTNFYVHLVTDDTPPTVDHNTLGDLDEVPQANGYTPYQLDRNATDFDVLNEDDANDLAEIEVKDISWTASGGSIPSTGNDARWAVLTDDNVTESSRQLIFCWDLSAGRSVSDGQVLTFEGLTMRAEEP